MTPVQTSATSSVMPRALIIGAGPEALIGIEPMLGANRFRVDFLEKDSTPYIAIRQRRPDLVVLCFAPDDDEACQVLQMLQLDPATQAPADPHLRQWRGLRYNPEPMASDKRDSERVEFLGALHGEVMVFQPSAVRQMSHGGMQVETSFPLQLDSLHDFRLTLGDRSVVVKGRIAHSRISDVDQDIITYRTGVEFIELSERVAAAIQHFVDELAKEKSQATGLTRAFR